MQILFWNRSGNASACAVLLLLLITRICIHAQNMTPQQERALQAANDIAEKARTLEADNQWEKALPLRRELTAGLVAAFGQGSPEADEARRTIADSLSMLGRNREARDVLEQCLAARRAALGERHYLVADALLRIGETHRREGRLTNAWSFYTRAEEIVAKQPDQQELFALVLNNQAIVLSVQGDLRGAETRWSRALALMTNAPAADPIQAAAMWSSLGEVRRTLGRVGEAEADQRRAQALMADLPLHHPHRLLAENNLGSVLRDMGRTREAIVLHERSIAALEAQRGPDDLDVLVMRRNLALALVRERRHADALRLADDGLSRLTRSGRTAHPLFVTLQTDRADCLVELGDYDTARQVCESIIQRQQQESGSDHPMVWAARERAALVMMRQGDLSAARRLLGSVLEYRRQRAGDSPRQQEELASTLLEWARFQRTLGRWEEADRRLRECFQIVEQHVGPSHPLAAEIWTEAGYLAQVQGRLEEASACHETARRIRRQALGEKSLQAAMSQMNLAEVRSRQGRTGEAMAEARSALTVLTDLLAETSPLLAGAGYELALHLHRDGQLDEAAGRYELALAVFERLRSPRAAAATCDLALLELERGRPEVAAQHAARASARHEELWRNLLRYGSANDRLAWQEAYDVFSALASVATNSPLPLAQAVLRFKGAVLDSLIEDAQLNTAAGRNTVGSEPLRMARRDRYRLEMLATSPRPPTAEILRDAQSKVEQLESSLAQRWTALDHNRRLFDATVEGIQKALPADAVLIEFVRYRHWLGKGKSEERFGALVFRPDAPPQWVILGPVAGESGIGPAVALWQKTIHQKPPPEGAAVTTPLAQLYDLVWARLARSIPSETRTVIIAPDGMLHFVSFAALWKKDHFLGEDLAFVYVSSGRDLLTPSPKLPRQRSVRLFANPTFARSTWQRRVAEPLKNSLNALCDVLALRGGGEQELIDPYGPLPGTASEVEALAKLARRHGCQPVQIFTGLDASETSLTQIPSPYLLHFATHGTFLTGSAATTRDRTTALDRPVPIIPQHPMHRSWVALARANETLDEWRSGRIPDPYSDGLLTAEEAAQLSLHETWLVTLSACDTGLGTSQAGEGVFGLRRGFALAGARHVLMTLWPVDDDRTRTFMESFYADALTTNDAPGALGRTQRRLLGEWRKQDGAGRAARFAGAFVISSQGQ